MQITAVSNNLSHANIKVNSKPALAPTGPRAYKGMSIVRSYQRQLTDGSTQPLDQPQVGDLIKVNLDVTFPETLEYVVIEDRLPSILEAVNDDFESQKSRFKGNSQNHWLINHQELRADRALFFVNRSWNDSTQTISYLARVTSAGTATSPAAKVECMYDPLQLAITESLRLTTIKKKAVSSK